MDPALLRLVDANANRAREALRMMEDLARFVLDDADLARACKEARHELAGALASIDPGRRLVSRDTAGDVGRELSTDAERTRRGPQDLAAAAGARLSEALRALEEAAKTLRGDSGPAPPARALESLRYRAYTLDRGLRLALASPGPAQWRLCVLLSESLCTHHAWERVAELSLEGGADSLQLREKTLPDRELLARAERLVAIARSHPSRAHVIVNDRTDVALLSGAHAVHLGRTDLRIADARRLAGFSLLVGASCGTTDEARAAHREGADVIALGAMFPTRTKEKPRISGPELLRGFLADPHLASRPHLAIGGITPERAGELAALGCRGVAVSSAVCAAEDPRAVCARIREELRRAEP